MRLKDIRRSVSERGLEFGFQAGLLAKFVCGDSIELPMTFDWNDLRSVGVDGMIRTFPEQMEMMLLEVSDEITSFD